MINDEPLAVLVMRRRSAQQAWLLIREFSLQAMIRSQELVIANAWQQAELHQLNHHSSARI